MPHSRTHEHVQRWVWLLVLASLAAGGSAWAAARPMTPPTRPPSGGGHLTLAELRALAASVGFPDPDVAAAVAMAESGGNPFAVGDEGTSFGLWQIHTPAHPEFEASRLLDASYNAHAALLISQSGADWTPWTTFRTGAYKQYMGGNA